MLHNCLKMQLSVWIKVPHNFSDTIIGMFVQNYYEWFSLIKVSEPNVPPSILMVIWSWKHHKLSYKENCQKFLFLLLPEK